jgi:cysteine-rich repeat protein
MRVVFACVLVFACGKVQKQKPDAAVDAAVDANQCGNHVVDLGEDCDDGNLNENDDCTNACTFNTPFPSDGSEGAFAPAADTQLPAGVHNYTTITIPAGVKVTTTGEGTLDLRATGAVQIDGTIDVSGGRGADGVASMTPSSYTGGGGGGATGDPLAAPPTGDCPAAAGGGIGPAGTAGVQFTSSSCPDVQPGMFGGGAGGGCCAGGGGGGGPAGGGSDGGGGGVADQSNGSTRTPGRGGNAPGAYHGGDGSIVAGCSDPYPGSGGGGGSIGTMAAADLPVTTTFAPGSGGGGGGTQCNVYSHGSGGGGGGGGALRIATTASITIGATGKVVADGGAGGNGYTDATNTAGDKGNNGGGGGSGGVIYLAAPTLTVASGAVVSAVGGIGGVSPGSACGGGGAGGLGRVRISARLTTCSLSGNFTPPLSSGCSLSVADEHVYIGAFPN